MPVQTNANPTIDPRNFHRKVLASDDLVEPTGEQVTRGSGRPARLFHAGTMSHPGASMRGSDELAVLWDITMPLLRFVVDKMQWEQLPSQDCARSVGQTS